MHIFWPRELENTLINGEFSNHYQLKKRQKGPAARVNHDHDPTTLTKTTRTLLGDIALMEQSSAQGTMAAQLSTRRSSPNAFRCMTCQFLRLDICVHDPKQFNERAKERQERKEQGRMGSKHKRGRKKRQSPFSVPAA